MYGIQMNNDSSAARTGVPVDEYHYRQDSAAQDIDDAVSESTKEDGQDMPGHQMTKTSDDVDPDPVAEMERRSSVVQTLARSYSRASGVGPNDNPFAAGADSPLNPHSEKFSARAWAKAIVELVQQSGSSFRTSGIAFQNLNVHGFGASTDYQKDVANVWYSLGSLAQNMVRSNRQRIDILRNFDGLVKNGEMLVVLGPPGSGCSTFLKTLSGEMNGIYVEDGSYFNYQGKVLKEYPKKILIV